MTNKILTLFINGNEDTTNMTIDKEWGVTLILFRSKEQKNLQNLIIVTGLQQGCF